MRVLLIGSGGREHALAWHFKHHSPELEALFIAPGNPGTAQCGVNLALDINNHHDIIQTAKDNKVDLIVCGPEAPLVGGLYDACEKENIPCVGPSKTAAQLEGSKEFTKEICDAASIPTAQWHSFQNLDNAHAHIDNHQAPFVIKADGLAGGKGVVIAQSKEQAHQTVTEMLENDKLGKAGHKIVIEDFLEGEEISLFALCCGQQARFLGTARDHKRLNDGGEGPNTGGMGAISPPPGITKEKQQELMDLFIYPALKEMDRRGTPFEGILFAGIICTKKGPYLLEYNVRLGDPEAETLLPLIKDDLLKILSDIAHHKMKETKPLTLKEKISICVILAAEGYPTHTKKGAIIEGACDRAIEPFTTIFQCGTKRNQLRQLEVNGGRVIAITSLGKTKQQARELVYSAVDHIEWPGMHYRKDIAL